MATLGSSGFAPAATVVTAFNGGTSEGWSLIGLVSPSNGLPLRVNGPYALNVATTGGSDGGGYISGTDTTADALYFAASPLFLGNKSAFVNGTLSFAIRNTGDPKIAIQPNDSPVILVNSAGTKALYQSLLPNSNGVASNTVGTTFSTLSYTLGVGANWKYYGPAASNVTATAQDFADILGDLGAAYILGDYRAGNGETTSIDNVQLVSLPNAAPEPSTAVLTLLATSATLGRRQRLTRPSLGASRHDAARS